jgi:hypothetical protein
VEVTASVYPIQLIVLQSMYGNVRKDTPGRLGLVRLNMEPGVLFVVPIIIKKV